MGAPTQPGGVVGTSGGGHHGVSVHFTKWADGPDGGTFNREVTQGQQLGDFKWPNVAWGTRRSGSEGPNPVLRLDNWKWEGGGPLGRWAGQGAAGLGTSPPGTPRGPARCRFWDPGRQIPLWLLPRQPGLSWRAGLGRLSPPLGLLSLLPPLVQGASCPWTPPHCLSSQPLSPAASAGPHPGLGRSLGPPRVGWG